jgi:Cysteine rich repeat
MEADPVKRASGLNCLQQFREELRSVECRDKVHRKMSRAARDIRFDDVLANACQEDRRMYCNDVQPGSARVIRCLQEHRPNLGQKCAAALFDHEVKMAEDIDFKYPMKKACAWEMGRFCKGVPHGHARVMRCLQVRCLRAAVPAHTCMDGKLSSLAHTAAYCSLTTAAATLPASSYKGTVPPPTHKMCYSRSLACLRACCFNTHRSTLMMMTCQLNARVR